MNALIKRTPAEIAFYYKAARPSGSVDLFVEGIDDKLLLDTYIARREARGCAVYTMDTIDFSGFDFRALRLPAPSARSSVIALRKFLIDEGVDVDAHFFLVDRDMEDLCTTPFIAGVELTDSGALPVHLYDNATEQKLADLIYEGRIASNVLKASVASISTEIYLLKAACRRLELGVRILPPTDFIIGNAVDGFALDSSGYTERCLRSSALLGRWGEVAEAVETCKRDLLDTSHRKFALINDHTLWDVLRIIGNKLGSRNNPSSQDIENMIRMTFDVSQLSDHRLFRAIDEHVRARTDLPRDT